MCANTLFSPDSIIWLIMDMIFADKLVNFIMLHKYFDIFDIYINTFPTYIIDYTGKVKYIGIMLK